MILRLVVRDDDPIDLMRLLLWPPSPFVEVELAVADDPDPFALFKIMAIMFCLGRRLARALLNLDEGMAAVYIFNLFGASVCTRRAVVALGDSKVKDDDASESELVKTRQQRGTRSSLTIALLLIKIDQPSSLES